MQCSQTLGGGPDLVQEVGFVPPLLLLLGVLLQDPLQHLLRHWLRLLPLLTVPAGTVLAAEEGGGGGG